jgi:hypothetical protein
MKSEKKYRKRNVNNVKGQKLNTHIEIIKIKTNKQILVLVSPLSTY